jgi:hypothetical protein
LSSNLSVLPLLATHATAHTESLFVDYRPYLLNTDKKKRKDFDRFGAESAQWEGRIEKINTNDK